jgi:hypothetical protein
MPESAGGKYRRAPPPGTNGIAKLEIPEEFRLI